MAVAAGTSGVVNLARFLGRAAEPGAGFLQSALQFSTAGGVAAYKLPELQYAYSALGEQQAAALCALSLPPHATGSLALAFCAWWCCRSLLVVPRGRPSAHTRTPAAAQP